MDTMTRATWEYLPFAQNALGAGFTLPLSA